eukprot:COSAG05_NODE_289_length_12065_cov_9.271519_4_plen_655_part_00
MNLRKENLRQQYRFASLGGLDVARSPRPQQALTPSCPRHSNDTALRLGTGRQSLGPIGIGRGPPTISWSPRQKIVTWHQRHPRAYQPASSAGGGWPCTPEPAAPSDERVDAERLGGMVGTMWFPSLGSSRRRQQQPTEGEEQEATKRSRAYKSANQSFYADMAEEHVDTLRRAAASIKKKDSRQAIQYLNLLLEAYPQTAHLYTLRAMCMYRLKSYSSSFKNAKTALRLDPSQCKANYYAGRAAAKLGKAKLGASFLQTALNQDPGNTTYHTEWVRLNQLINVERTFYGHRIRVKDPLPKAVHGQGTPEPEPEDAPPPVAAEMDEDWRHMDISDIAYEQTLLHDAIVDAVDDGQVDPREITQITNMMKRSLGGGKYGKTMVKKVQAALGDGDLSEEDMALLRSLCPPEPRDDWDRIVASFQSEFGYLKTLFRYYALQGSGDGDGDDMGKGQFSAYAAEIQVLDKSSIDLNAGCIDRIFLRGNQDRTGGLDIFKRENQGKKLKDKAGARGDGAIDNEMELKEFVCANVRLAHAKYRELPSLADRWEKLLADNIKPFANLGDVEDEVTILLESRSGRAWIGKWLSLFEIIFGAYCMSDSEVGSGTSKQTMDMKEFLGFLADAGLLGKALTNREARGIFVQVRNTPTRILKYNVHCM